MLTIMMPLYGGPTEFANRAKTPTFISVILNILNAIVKILSSTTTIIFAFIIGSIMFLITKKKIYIIIPLVLPVLWFIFKIFGLS
jgi:hypothetical protein